VTAVADIIGAGVLGFAFGYAMATVAEAIAGVLERVRR